MITSDNPRRPPPPGTLAALCLLIIAVATWRFAPTWAGFVVSALALAWTWHAGRAMAGESRWIERVSALALTLSGLLMLSKYAEALWPCDISCHGGGGYEHLFGVLVVTWAFGACVFYFVSLAVFGIWRRRSAADGCAQVPSPLQAGGWIMIGGSLFYLWTAWRLGMPCHQCLAMHTALLGMAGPLRFGTLRVFVRAVMVIAGFGALLITYGPNLRSDLSDPLPQPNGIGIPVDDAAFSARADANRRRGRVDAPYTLELALEFQCSHCEREYAELEPKILPLITAGTLQVIVRPVVRRSEPASLDLVRWSFAAAAAGERPFQRYLETMLGTRTGVTSPQLLNGPNAEVARLGQLASEADMHTVTIAQVIESDRKRLVELGATLALPYAVLRDRSGASLGHWSVRIDHERLIALVATGTEQR